MKYNQWWGNNRGKMKKSMRARLRWTEEQWSNNVSHCAIFQWVVNQCNGDSSVTPEMIDSMTSAFLNGFLRKNMFFFTKCFCWVFLLCQIVRDHSNRLRDYSQDLDAILLAKPQRFTPEMTAMWQDHVGRAILRPQGSMKEDESEALDQAQDTRRKLFDFLFGAF